MSRPLTPSIAVIGAGLVGKRHAKMLANHPRCNLAAIVDPDPDCAELAEELGCQYFQQISSMTPDECDAAIIATPNATHEPIGIECAQRGWHCLIEKPIADTVESGIRLARVFSDKKLKLLIGHHRRYHPFVTAARELIRSGKLGHPIIASVMWAVRKPDEYFQQGAWRLGKDGGPILINFIHEIDLMQCIFGPVIQVQAQTSNTHRGNSVEDTAVIILRFENSLLATVTISDAALTPWSFEGATGENPNIARTNTSPWRIGCTNGAFEFPTMNIWQNSQPGQGDWSKPLTMTNPAYDEVNPLQEQISHFVSLICQKDSHPMVSACDGIAAMKTIRAIQKSARLGKMVIVADEKRHLEQVNNQI